MLVELLAGDLSRGEVYNDYNHTHSLILPPLYYLIIPAVNYKYLIYINAHGWNKPMSPLKHHNVKHIYDQLNMLKRKGLSSIPL